MKTKKEILDYLVLRMMTLYTISSRLCELLINEKDINKFSKLSNLLNTVNNNLTLLISIDNYIYGKEKD